MESLELIFVSMKFAQALEALKVVGSLTSGLQGCFGTFDEAESSGRGEVLPPAIWTNIDLS